MNKYLPVIVTTAKIVVAVGTALLTVLDGDPW